LFGTIWLRNGGKVEKVTSFSSDVTKTYPDLTIQGRKKQEKQIKSRGRVIEKLKGLATQNP